MNKENYSLYSFDIFDTLITRRTGNPRGIFSIIQNTLFEDSTYNDIPKIVKENFYSLRVESEFFIRDNMRHFGKKEISINEIYDFIANNIPLTEEQKIKLLNLELKTEEANIIPITQNIKLVKELIANNKKVILISDMYLSSSFIYNLLCKIDKIFENIPIYVSCEYNKTKKDGDLYQYIQQKENVEYSKWYHFGDNIKGDFEIPKNKGINVELYSYTSLFPYEEEILRRYPESAYIALAVGASKNCRLFFEKSDNEKYNLGNSLGGPLLYPYIKWIINQVKVKKLSRLYFVMRDGEVLKELYDCIASKHNLDTKTKLIYGSREAWRSVSITKENSDFSFMFASRREINSIRKIALRFHISLDSLLKILPVDFSDVDKIFSDEEFNNIKKILLDSKEFLDLVEKENESQRVLLKRYIQQEMDISDNRFAIVDLAASGRTQMCFVNVINEIKDMVINGFYAQFNGFKINCEKFNMSAFYTTAKVKSWLELFCRSECGYTKYYKQENNKIVPVLEEAEGLALKEYKYSDVIQGEKDFCIEFFDNLLKNPFVTISYKQFIFYLDYIASRPYKKLANLIGDIPFSNYYGVKDNVYLCAPKIKLKDLVFGYDETQVQLPTLSYIRSSKLIKKLIEHKKKYRSIKSQLLKLHLKKKSK